MSKHQIFFDSIKLNETPDELVCQGKRSKYESMADIVISLPKEQVKRILTSKNLEITINTNDENA